MTPILQLTHAAAQVLHDDGSRMALRALCAEQLFRCHPLERKKPKRPISCKLFFRFQEEVSVLSHDVICRRMCNFQ